MSNCISCGENEVTFPLVCSDCTDREAQAYLYLMQGEGWECRSCGMIYDGGMRCTYCGDIDPLDTGEFFEEDDLMNFILEAGAE